MALGASRLVDAQGFVTNCTWQTGFMANSFLGMYCNNDNWASFSYDWTCRSDTQITQMTQIHRQHWKRSTPTNTAALILRLDTNACLSNRGGKLYAHDMDMNMAQRKLLVNLWQLLGAREQRGLSHDLQLPGRRWAVYARYL
ncbi:hypothetical protein AAE478_002393 [Parahypoxylon ruwenzoriense]